MALAKQSILSMIQAHYPGYHPLVSIAHMAHSPDLDPRLVFDCHRVIAKYVEPELKSLEVKGKFDETRRVVVSLFDENDESVAEIIDSDVPLTNIVNVS